MTKGVDHYIANNTMKIGRLIAERMPHLKFAFWDLSEFMSAFHNVRRNMIFVECEKIAKEEVIRVLAEDPKMRDYLVYSGERKPKAVNEEWANAKSTEEIRDVIVVLARKDFGETEVYSGNACVPTLERRLTDLIYYSLKGYLPITLDEAINALEWNLNKTGISITRMQRYATRRYIGWFFGIILYSLVKKNRVNPHMAGIDPRYLDSGKRYYDAILNLKVDEL